ncbi:uncharacterized protein LOC114255498 [Monomorium pharaonis]|uniref:uncharacterized protein LOC114255498 n=1 Tax=Monomorium pharaonis TaxID=307658 RepID=UPI00102E104B|nr:uncharacterized protein LOC114255498 [Monomorium pharaonis]XP_028050227.1 uncharacterized protein LOC114255498 [Monomorium pharaonis]
MSSVKNLKQALMPVIWLNCIFCIGIFEIPKNRPRYYLSAFYVIAILIGYSIFFYNGSDILQKTLVFNHVMFYVILGINALVAVLAIILFWKKSEGMNSIIKKNEIVDDTLEALGIKKEYEKIFRNILFLVAIWTVTIIVIFNMSILWTYREIGYWYSFYGAVCVGFPLTINFVIDLTFASLIRQVNIFSRKYSNNKKVYPKNYNC